jgi:aryl-alcohol dehydrogenase-like predicted oxidoreductase
MIPTKPFGRTGHESTRVLFGACALNHATPEETDATMARVVEAGINHIDTAVMYGDSEERLGPWMETHRERFFLATKTDQRTRDGAWAELEGSLRRLRTDHVDLWQMHVLVDAADWDVAMGPGGALEAFVEARDQGLVRFLGVTGHGLEAPRMHLRSLGRFDFDTVLLPYHYMVMRNPQYAAEFNMLLDLCRQRNVAVQTIKSIAWKRWDDAPPTRNPWYKPLETPEAIDTAVHWVLGNPHVFLNSVADMDLLPLVIDAAERFERRPSDMEMHALVKEYAIEPIFV